MARAKPPTVFAEDAPLTEVEVATLVAELADKVLAMTEDPGEQEQIVNDLGDVLEGWNTSFPLIPHPLSSVVEEILAASGNGDQKNHVAHKRNGGNGNGKPNGNGGA